MVFFLKTKLVIVITKFLKDHYVWGVSKKQTSGNFLLFPNGGNLLSKKVSGISLQCIFGVFCFER